MNTNYDDKQVAIICSHVARQNLPILRAVRTEPLEPEDSGWQFLCNSGKIEDESEAQVWLLGEVLRLDRSFRKYANSPVGTKLSRTNEDAKWQPEDSGIRS